MSADRGLVRGIRLYVGSLAACCIVIVAIATIVAWNEGIDEWFAWFILSALFGVTESTLLYFHHPRGRQSFSASEAVLLPMFFILPLPQVIIGVTAAMLAARPFQRDEGLMRSIFNVSQSGIATSAAAGMWWLAASDGAFTARGAAAGCLAVITYAVVNHALVTGAIAISERASYLVVLRGVALPMLWNLLLNISLGLMFAGAIVAASWSVVLFPLPLAALFLGYRAIVRQEGDRERIQKLHEATRALVASPSLDSAVDSFLTAACRIVSAGGAAVLVGDGSGAVSWRVAGDEVIGPTEPRADDPLLDLAVHLRRSGRSVIVKQDESSPWRNFADDLGARSMIAIPLEDEHIGCLVVMDRVGADDFSPDDSALLEALAQELVLALGSYRLFSDVSRERERFERIFTGSQEGICLLDGDGIVLAWNEALETITGFSADEVVGSLLSDRLLVRDRNKHRLDTWELVSASSETELEVVTNEGPSRWISVLSGSVSAKGGEGSWVVLFRDVTAAHEVEQSKSDFLSTVSHELRTPLTSIKGSLQIMQRGHEALSPDTHEQMVDIMQRSSDRLERLLLNLLFVSRVETDGHLSMIPDEVDIEKVVERALVSAQLEEYEVNLTVEPGFHPKVAGEYEAILQVVEHLLDNARKFGGGGPISIALARNSRFVEVTVSDEGPGIARADQERIFERFVRLGSPLTRATQGSGVGLFIVKTVVEAAQGKVWVESDVGRGSSFHVLLPLLRPLRIAPTAAAEG